MTLVRVFYPSGKPVLPAGHPGREDSAPASAQSSAEQPRLDPKSYPADERPASTWTVAQLTAWADDHDEELPTGLKEKKVRAAQELYDAMHEPEQSTAQAVDPPPAHTPTPRIEVVYESIPGYEDEEEIA